MQTQEMFHHEAGAPLLKRFVPSPRPGGYRKRRLREELAVMLKTDSLTPTSQMTSTSTCTSNVGANHLTTSSHVVIEPGDRLAIDDEGPETTRRPAVRRRP
jgi:hypothetical protein